MNQNTKRILFAIWGGLSLLLLSSCTQTSNNDLTGSELIPVVEPTNETREETTLVVCLAEEPQHLNPMVSNPTALPILATIYDGPIETINYAYYPTILTKIPSLLDGDAWVEPISVTVGDLIVNADGEIVSLAEGVHFLPSGCTNSECAETYAEGEITMDQIGVRFTLLNDLLWADGNPLTTTDSVFSYALAFTGLNTEQEGLANFTASYIPASPTNVTWLGLPGFRTQDFATFFFTPYPEHAWGDFSATELVQNQSILTAPLGWGPYQVVKWTRGQSLTLSKNPNYFQSDLGLPYFDHLQFLFLGEDDAARIEMIETGECDVLDQSATLMNHFDSILGSAVEEKLKAQDTQSLFWEQLSFGIESNADRPDFFGDPRTRQAIAYCINRDAIRTEITKGLAPQIESYVSQIHPLANPNIQTYEYDPEVGKTLLNSVGWITETDGARSARNIPNIPVDTRFSIQYWAVDTPMARLIAELIIADLNTCGIEVHPSFGTQEELLETGPEGLIFGRNFDLAQFKWFSAIHPPCQLFTSENIPGSPETYPLGWAGWNVSGMRNLEFDGACDQALESLSGSIDYLEGHWLAQQIFSEELPLLPLFTDIELSVTRPEICNVLPTPTTGTVLWNVENFTLGDICP